MATFTKMLLSGSTNGRQIKVAATATPGTLLHTAVTGTTDLDEIWLYATNSSTVAIALTLELGGTTSPDDLIQLSIPSKEGLVLVVPGLLLQNGLVARAFAGSANVILMSGFVNRITP